MKDERQTNRERQRQIQKLVESSSREGQERIENGRRDGRRLRAELEDAEGNNS